MKYKYKPYIEALQFTTNPERLSKISEFVGSTISVKFNVIEEPVLNLGPYSSCSRMTIKLGGWIAKGYNGQLFHITKEQFEECYEPAKNPKEEFSAANFQDITNQLASLAAAIR